MNRKACTTLVAATAFLATAALANNGIGTQTIEFDGGISQDDPVWVECVGDYVYGPFHVVAKTHEFETPSGTYHWIENWKLTQTLTGLSTGWVWLTTSVSPTNQNMVKDGGILQWTENGVARPVEEGLTFRYSIKVQFKVDKNGDETVFVNFATGDFKCLGPQK